MNEPQNQSRTWLGFCLQLKVLLPVLGFLLLLMLLSVLVLYREYCLSLIPPIERPFDKEEFCKVDFSDEENAWTHYRPILARLPKIPIALHQTWERQRQRDSLWSIEPEEQQFLDDVHELMLKWRHATRLEKSRYLNPAQVNINTERPELEAGWKTAKIAFMKAMEAQSRGQQEEARDWLLAAYRFSRHHGHKGIMEERLVGVGTHNQTLAELQLWAAHPDVTAEQLQVALEAVRKDYQLTAPFSDNLIAEYLCFENSITSISDAAFFFRFSLARYQVPYFQFYGYLWLLGEPETSFRMYRHILTNQLPNVDLPRWERRPQIPGETWLFEPDPKVAPSNRLAPTQMTDTRSKALVYTVAAPETARTDIAIRREKADRECLMVVLAAQIHRRLHGEYPATLDEMIPQILPEKPRDPFSPTGAPLNYRLLKVRTGFVYSVGENEVDDGGKVFGDFLTFERDLGMQFWIRNLEEPESALHPWNLPFRN